MAVSREWPITPDGRKLIVDEMMVIVETSKSARSKIGASRVVLSADGVNVQREKIATPQEHVHRLGEPLRVTGIHVEAQDRVIEGEGKVVEE